MHAIASEVVRQCTHAQRAEIALCSRLLVFTPCRPLIHRRKCCTTCEKTDTWVCVTDFASTLVQGHVQMCTGAVNRS
jgi:hypothetical protein